MQQCRVRSAGTNTLCAVSECNTEQAGSGVLWEWAHICATVTTPPTLPQVHATHRHTHPHLHSHRTYAPTFACDRSDRRAASSRASVPSQECTHWRDPGIPGPVQETEDPESGSDSCVSVLYACCVLCAECSVCLCFVFWWLCALCFCVKELVAVNCFTMLGRQPVDRASAGCTA